MSTIKGSQSPNQESLQAVMPHVKAFASWAALLLGIRTVVRVLEQVGIAGLIAIFANLVWSTITFFVVPVIVFEGLDCKYRQETFVIFSASQVPIREIEFQRYD